MRSPLARQSVSLAPLAAAKVGFKKAFAVPVASATTDTVFTAQHTRSWLPDAVPPLHSTSFPIQSIVIFAVEPVQPGGTRKFQTPKLSTPELKFAVMKVLPVVPLVISPWQPPTVGQVMSPARRFTQGSLGATQERFAVPAVPSVAR